MAQKIQTLFIDDIDGSDAVGTVRFSLDGTEYEIDLNTVHSEELRTALAPYITHGRKVGSAARNSTGPGGRTSAPGGTNRLDTAKVREWARAQGIDVKDRGRVPADVITKYQAAKGGKSGGNVTAITSAPSAPASAAFRARAAVNS